MAKVRFSNAALKDLESISVYISIDSELYAERVVEKIYKRIKTLEAHTHIGKIVREFSDASLREILEHPYRIIYKIVSEDEILK